MNQKNTNFWNLVELYLNLANELDVNPYHVDWGEGFDKSQKLWKIHKRCDCW